MSQSDEFGIYLLSITPTFHFSVSARNKLQFPKGKGKYMQETYSYVETLTKTDDRLVHRYFPTQFAGESVLDALSKIN